MALSRRTRRRLILLGLIVVVIAGGAFAAKGVLEWRRSRAIEEARATGFAAYSDGDHAAALESLGPLLRQFSDDLELVRAVAFSRVRLEEPDGGHLARAAVLLQRVVELDPSDVEAHRELLSIYPRLGFLRETLDTSDAILEAMPGDAEAMEARVRVLAALGRWSEASEVSASLVAADPDSERWKQLQISTALAGGAPVEEVIELAAQWPKSTFADGLDDLVLAALLAISGEVDGANNLIDAAVARGAGSGDRLAAMLSILADLGREADADALIRTFASKGDPGDAAFAVIASDWSLGAGRTDFVEELFEAAPENSQARAEYLIPLSLMTMGWQGADRDRWMEAIKRSSPVRVEAARAREAILAFDAVVAAGDRTAIEKATAAARRGDATVPELLATSMIAGSIGDSAGAKRFALAAEKSRNTLLGGMLLADSHARQGELVEAIGVSVSLLERYPSRVDPAVVLVTLWASAGTLPSDLLTRVRRQTGAGNALAFAERIVEVVGMIPVVASAYVEAAIEQRRPDLLEDAIVSLVTAEPPPVDAMLRVHGRILDLAPNLAASLRSRLAEVAAADPRVLALSIDPSQVGAELVVRLREVLPLEDADPTVREDAWLAAMSRIGSLTEPEFRDLAGEALAACPDSVALVGRILVDPRSWGDSGFARRIVDRSGELRGTDSVEYVLAEATWVLQHDADDVEARGVSIAKMNEQWLADPGSFTVGATLLRLLIADSKSDPQSAIRLGRQLIASRPDALELYPIVVSLMQSQGMLADAERLLLEFEARDRDGTISARQRAAVNYQQGNLEELVRSLAKLSARSGDAADAISLGMAAEATGDLASAERAYREALQDKRTAAEALVRLGAVLRRMGRLEDFERTLQAEGGVLTDLQREISLAELQFSGGDQRGAMARLAAAAERNPEEVPAWSALARACLVVGDAKSAGDAAIRGLRLDADSQELQSVAMTAAIQDGSWADTAVLGGGSGGTLPPVLVEGVRVLRAARTSDGRLAPDAPLLRSSRELCSRFGDSINAWRVAAALHQAAGQLADAKSIADAAARRFPDAADPVEWQIVAASGLGNLELASSLCIEWRRRSFPDVRRVDEAHAAIELARKRPDAALPLLARHRDLIIRDATARPGPYRALIASLMMTGAVRDAAELDRANLSASEASRATWAQIATMAPYPQGLEAMSILEAASPSDPFGRAQMIGRWIAFHERHPNGRGLDRARSLLPRSVSVPKDFDSRIAVIAKSDIERVAGDPAAARASLQSVINSYPRDIQERAKTVGSLSGPAQQELFREIEPLLYARNNLAMLLVEMDVSLDEALALVEQCVEIIPGNPDLRDTEAQVLMKLGRLSEAEQSSVMAIRAYPQNTSVLLTGVEILAASGRVEDAKQLMQRIRDIVAQEPWPSRQVEDRLRRVASAIDSQP